MTETQSVTLPCPDCGFEQKVQVWRSVNVTLDGNLRDRLFNGEINRFECQSCGVRKFMNVPLMYHDMTRQFAIQYLPEQVIEDAEQLSSYSADGSVNTEHFPQKMIDAASYMLRPHIVFDMGEMLRYIVFREKLADREQPAE